MGSSISKAWNFVKSSTNDYVFKPVKALWLIGTDIWVWALLGLAIGAAILLPETLALTANLPPMVAIWIFPLVSLGLWWLTSALIAAEKIDNVNGT